MAQERGIEVFGRIATLVKPGASRPRTPALGVGSVLLAVIATTALVGALVERENRSGYAPGLTVAALVVSAAAVLVGVAAVVSDRGRRVAIVGIALGALSNPWLLGRLLEAVAAL